MSANDFRTVTIPGCVEHAGLAAITITLPWRCIVCDGPRGEPYSTQSYDGSLRLGVHGWHNPCGHVEKYSAIREWIAANPDKVST